jgi:hypothetical protein
MMPSRRSLPVVAAALGAVWLVTASPAHSGGAKSDGRNERREMMDDRNFNDVDVDKTRKNKRANVVVEMDATRHGNDRNVDCVYNPDIGNTRIRK